MGVFFAMKVRAGAHAKLVAQGYRPLKVASVMYLADDDAINNLVAKANATAQVDAAETPPAPKTMANQEPPKLDGNGQPIVKETKMVEAFGDGTILTEIFQQLDAFIQSPLGQQVESALVTLLLTALGGVKF